MARIDIDAALRESNNRGKLWWHGTSSWHIRSIKDEGLSEEVECRAWNCEPGIYFDRNASMAGGLWARNAVNSAAGFEISGKGYPFGKFKDYFPRMFEDMFLAGEIDEETAEKRLNVPWEDLKSVEEYLADDEQWGKSRQDINKILLVMDEDQIPEDCTQKYNGHWHAVSGWGSNMPNEKYLRNPDGTPKTEYPYGVDTIPDLTDEEQSLLIYMIEQELILNNCRVPTSRFYACNTDEAEIFTGMMLGEPERSAEIALEGRKGRWSSISEAEAARLIRIGRA